MSIGENCLAGLRTTMSAVPTNTNTGGSDPPPYSPNTSSCSLPPPPYSVVELLDRNENVSSDQNSPLPHSSEPQTSIRLNIVDLITEFSKLEKNVYWKTNEEGAVFFAARKKVLQSLSVVGSRMTELEKDEIALKVRNIDELRRSWIEEEEERREKERQEKEKKVARNRKNVLAATIITKLSMMILAVIIFLPVLNTRETTENLLLFVIVNISAIPITAFFAAFYCCNIIYVQKIVYFVDIFFGIMFAILYFFLAINRYEYSAAALHCLDICFKIFLIKTDKHYTVNNPGPCQSDMV